MAFLGTLPGDSLTSLLWKGLGWLNYFLYWVLFWSVWKFFSVAQDVASHKVEFMVYPEQLLNKACLGPFKFYLSWTCSWNYLVTSFENSRVWSLSLNTYDGLPFGGLYDNLKVVSFGGYLEWLWGWVNGSVLVPYLLEVAFNVSSVTGICILLNLKELLILHSNLAVSTYPVELMVYCLPSRMSGLNTSLDCSVNLFSRSESALTTGL